MQTINWSEAPAWAKYRATDKDGTVWWFEDRPVDYIDGWACLTGQSQRIPKFDWRKSLVERPKENQH